MNSKENIHRVPIPKDNVEMFIGMVFTFAELCGINKIPEIYHHVEMLSRGADLYLFEKRHGPVRQKAGDEKKRFILIFKERFRHEFDYEYPNTMKPVDLKMIGDFLTGKLAPKHIDMEFYLKWFFEVYLETRKHLIPPDMQNVVSSKAWNTFLFDNREQIKDQHERFMQESEGLDLINRARVVIRSTEDVSIKTKIIELLKKYKDGSIMIAEFRKEILALEKAIRP